MTLDLKNLCERAAALEIEALAVLTDIPTPNAVAYFWHTQETFPYFTNRLGDITLEADGQEFDVYNVDVIIRLILAHRTAGITKGLLEAELQRIIPRVIEYFNEHEMLQSAAYPTELTSLIYARITDCRGYSEFRNNAATADGQIGTEWTLRAVFEAELIQREV